ncbi:MAG: hypothetical protein AB1938_21825 [Myxococcota bacterium]
MTRALLFSSLLVLTACEPPPVFPGADKRANTVTGRIEGEVVVASAARGNVVLFLYDAARPPPPEGTGRPITFTVVPQDVLFAHAAPGDLGPHVAPYAFSLVPPGRYLIKGFVDASQDFVPWYGVTADTNTGDVGGAYVDPVTRAAKVVEVGVDANQVPIPALGVTVSFSDAARVPVDRPVFQETTGATSATLRSTAIRLLVDAFPIDAEGVYQPAPIFLARLVDANGDGVPDDSNGDGVPDFWPRVVVRKLAEGQSVLLDENDLDKNGVLDSEGVDYEHVNPMSGATIPADGKPDLCVLAAGFDFTALLPQLVDSMGRPNPAPTPVTRLELVVQPRAIDASDPLRPQVIKGVPAGKYAVTIIQQTGQTWRLPNELTPGLGDAVGLPAIVSQSFVVEVPAVLP